MGKWFLCENELVKGPYSTEEVEYHISNGSLNAQTMVWGQPQSQWLDVAEWKSQLSGLLSQIKSNGENQQWYYVCNGEKFGPMTKKNLILEVALVSNRGEILLWTKGMKAWAPIFEFHDVLEQVGLNRREHERAEATGSVIVKHEEKTLVGQLKTLSIGGFGIGGLPFLNPGDIVQVEIRADKIHEPIRIKAEVRYKSGEEFIGLKFASSLSTEYRSSIIDFIKSKKKKNAEFKIAS